MQDQKLTSEQADAVNRYLQTGTVDLYHCPWPGDIITGGPAQRSALREALAAELRRRTRGKTLPDMPALDLVAYTRKKVEPMVNGLFPGTERELFQCSFFSRFI